MQTPLRSLLFILSIAAMLLLAMGCLPASVKVGPLEWHFPQFEEVFETAIKNETAIKAIETISSIDTVEKSVNEIVADSIRLNTGIQYKNRQVLRSFFESLLHIKDQRMVRVLHYGDSQIEGDRISDYLRLKLQARFGGAGSGLQSLMPIAQGLITRYSNSPGWDRYSIYTMKDSRVNHSNYGVMAGFCRYAGYSKITDTTSEKSGTVTITTTKMGGANALNYKKIRLFYGGAQKPVWCEFYDGPALSSADSLKVGGVLNVKDFEVGLGSSTHEFRFKGQDSPDFYAVSFEGNSGIMVDNIPLRGSSGTFFHQINAAQLRTFYGLLNVKLIILQFGGNAMPAIKDAAGATTYGNYIKYQIAVIKKLAPEASILFIGPSDMSTKSGTQYVTVPYLEETRNAIKKVVLESDCAFFDMYDCMGGKNSMPVWVEQNLAAPDYTHFSPQGARKMAIMLYTALINEFNSWQASGK